jgi:PAS domain S-box-containing protein
MPSPLLYPIAAMAGGVLVYWWMSKRGSQRLDAAADQVTLAATAGDATLSLPAQNVSELLRFRAAVDLCNDSIYVVDRTTMRFVDATATAYRRSGYTREELLQMGPHDLVNEDRAELEVLYDEIIAAGGAGISTETVSSMKDGRQVTAQTHRHAIQVDGRWLIVSQSRNITERKLAELAALRVSRMYAALSATNEAIMRASAPEDLYQRVCDAAVDGGKFLAATICLPCPGKNEARATAVAGPGAERLRDVPISLDPANPEGQGVVGTAFHTGEACISNDSARTPGRVIGMHRRSRQALPPAPRCRWFAATGPSACSCCIRPRRMRSMTRS